MLDFLRGELARRGAGEVVVDVQGIGWLLAVSAQCLAALPARGSVTLHVHVHASESGTRLFGFLEEAERALFRQLQGVRGVGPGVALALLSHEPPAALAARIRSGDVKGLTRIKGVGTKTAERLVLELKDELGALAAGAPASGSHALLARALENLGLDAAEAGERARAVLGELSGELPLDQLLRAALKRRGAGR